MSQNKPIFRGVEHVGFTVPDIEEATRFLVDVMGCEQFYDLGPVVFDDDWIIVMIDGNNCITLDVVPGPPYGCTTDVTVIAYDDAGNSAVDTVTVTVPEPAPTPDILRPQIEITRLELSRTETCYHTGLRVENVGNVAASEIEVVDRLVGFQVRYSQDWPLKPKFPTQKSKPPA